MNVLLNFGSAQLNPLQIVRFTVRNGYGWYPMFDSVKHPYYIALRQRWWDRQPWYIKMFITAPLENYAEREWNSPAVIAQGQDKPLHIMTGFKSNREAEQFCEHMTRKHREKLAMFANASEV